MESHKTAIPSKLLRSKGLDLSLKDDNGCTAVEYASRTGHAAVLELFSAQGVTLLPSGKEAEVSEEVVYDPAKARAFQEKVRILVNKSTKRDAVAKLRLIVGNPQQYIKVSTMTHADLMVFCGRMYEERGCSGECERIVSDGRNLLVALQSVVASLGTAGAHEAGQKISSKGSVRRPANFLRDLPVKDVQQVAQRFREERIGQSYREFTVERRCKEEQKRPKPKVSPRDL